MPTFDTQAALQAGVPQEKIDAYLAQHPELQQGAAGAGSGGGGGGGQTPTAPANNAVASNPFSATSSPVGQQAASTPGVLKPQQNPSAAPIFGSVGQVGELTGAPVGFQNAALSQATNEDRGKLAETTQNLIKAAQQTSDPVRRARLLQVAHDNVMAMDSMASVSNKVSSMGQAATPDLHVPGLGTVTPATSMQQAAGIAAKTVSVDVPGGPLAMGALYGAGNTLEENGANATPGQVVFHAATNAAGGYLSGKILGNLTDMALGRYGFKGAVNASGKVIKTTSDYWDAVGQKLVGDAQKMSDANPQLVASFAGKGNLLQALSDSIPGLNLDMVAKGGLTPAEVQQVSSQINALAQKSPGKAGEYYALNANFRQWATEQFNKIQPGSGDQLQGLFSNAAKQYTAYNNLDKVLGGKLSSGDQEGLINEVKSLYNSSTGKIIANNAFKDFATAHGIDLTSEAKAMTYVATAAPATKAVFKFLVKTALEGAGLGAVVAGAKHVGL